MYPPFTVRLPLLSMPSPSVVISRVPPFTVTEHALSAVMESPDSPAALTASSEENIAMSPPFMVTEVPSRPSVHSVISSDPPLMISSSFAWQPSPSEVMVMVPLSMIRSSFDTIPWSAEFIMIVPSPLIVRSSFEKMTPSTFVSPSASNPVRLVR